MKKPILQSRDSARSLKPDKEKRNENNVSFGENMYMIYMVDKSERGDESLYYTQDELIAIRQEMKAEYSQCGYIRGLERCEDDAFGEAQERRRNHVSSILSLQREHDSTGVEDKRGIQILSSTLSKFDQSEAQLRASRDSLEAFNLHTTTNAQNQYMKAATAEEYAKKTRRKRLCRKPSRPEYTARYLCF